MGGKESDYKVLYNKNGVLSINLWMEGTAAYPDNVKSMSSSTLLQAKGSRRQMYFKLWFLAAMLRASQRAEIQSATEQIKKRPKSAMQMLLSSLMGLISKRKIFRDFLLMMVWSPFIMTTASLMRSRPFNRRENSSFHGRG